MKLYWQAWLAAVSFLTRLPINLREYNERIAGVSLLFFPLVGLLVGGLGALVFSLAVPALNHSLAVILALIAMTLVTGAFHEDGLADTADGLGGGWTTAAKLRIMKDSRIGTYGGMALLLLVQLKYSALLAIPPASVAATLVCAHVVARWSVLPLLRWLPYVGGEQGSGVSIAGAADTPKLVVTTVFAACVLGLLLPAGLLLATLLCLFILYFSGWLYRRQLGGVTGDTLGATNQVIETGVYLAVVASVPV